MVKLAINGFGRIGRRALVSALDIEGVDFVGINDLTDPQTLAYLLRYDSVHGRFDGTVEVDDNHLVINGDRIRIMAERDPSKLPWKELEVDVVLECTGFFTKREGATLHLDAGAKGVVISAPGKGLDLTVVMGVNDDLLTKDHRLVSNASCTTNCLAPVAKVLDDSFGITHGLMTTIHAYTTTQSILDAPNRKDVRRGRAAAMSMIPTTTGAAVAVAEVLPQLKGKLDGMAVRVPTPNVSLTDLTVTLDTDVTVESVNAALKAAADGSMKGILEFVEEPLVSVDFVGSSASSSVDAVLTRVIGGRQVKVLSWYDNENGYACRLVDLAMKMAKTIG